MPTAVEYDSEGEANLPAVQSNSNPGPIQDFTGRVKSPGSPIKLATWGVFTGGVFVMIIAVLILGPASIPGGIFHTLMGDDAWGLLGCTSLPAVQSVGGQPPPTGDKSDGLLLPAVQFGDGSVKPSDTDAIGDPDSLPPGPTAPQGLLGSLALSLNGLRTRLGGESFLPPNPCQAPPPPFESADGDPIPTDEPPETDPGLLPDYGPGPHIPDPNTCVAIAGDGVCTECENTDTDSDSCVCNMDKVCDPQEGFNCPDCQPTPIPVGDNVDDKPDKEKPARKDNKPCPAGVVCQR